MREIRGSYNSTSWYYEHWMNPLTTQNISHSTALCLKLCENHISTLWTTLSARLALICSRKDMFSRTISTSTYCFPCRMCFTAWKKLIPEESFEWDIAATVSMSILKCQNRARDEWRRAMSQNDWIWTWMKNFSPQHAVLFHVSATELFSIITFFVHHSLVTESVSNENKSPLISSSPHV